MKIIGVFVLLVLCPKPNYAQDHVDSIKSLYLEKIRDNGKTASRKVKEGKKNTVLSNDSKVRGHVTFINHSTLSVNEQEYKLSEIDFITVRTKGRTALAWALLSPGFFGNALFALVLGWSYIPAWYFPLGTGSSSILSTMGISYLMFYGKKFKLAYDVIENDSETWKIQIK